MQLRHELVYDATPDAVHTMLADPAYRERVARAQQAVSCSVDVTRPGPDGFEMVITQVQNTTGLPSLAKKIVGDTTDVEVRETWSDARRGRIEIVAPGKPTTASGTVSLVERGSGTAQVVELDVRVKVPLIGGKLEALMVDNIENGLRIEQTVGTAWLAGEESTGD